MSGQFKKQVQRVSDVLKAADEVRQAKREADEARDVYNEKLTALTLAQTELLNAAERS